MFWEWLFKKSHPVLQFALLFVRTVTTPDFRREIHPLSLFGSFPCDQLNWALLVQGLPRIVEILLQLLAFQKGSRNDKTVPLHSLDIFIIDEYLWSAHSEVACQFWTQIRGKFFYSIVGEGSVIWLTMLLLTSESLPFPGKNKMSFCKGKSKVSANT